MSNTIGFIGCGNMGEALLSTLLETQFIQKEKISVACKSVATKDRIHATYDVFTSLDVREVAQRSRYLVLAIKPQDSESVLTSLQGIVKDTCIISLMAAKSITTIQTTLSNKKASIVRVMPTIALQVGKSMSAMCFSERVTKQQKQYIQQLFQVVGKVEEVKEEDMNTVVALSGSAPAYFYMIIEAMVAFGVQQGMSTRQARLFASQAALGAACMVQEDTREIPVLIDAVCSKKGTTMEAVQVLEEKQIQTIMKEAMEACYQRSILLNEESK